MFILSRLLVGLVSTVGGAGFRRCAVVLPLLLVAPSSLRAAGEAPAADVPLQRFRDVRPSMGTTFEIVLYASGAEVAAQAFDAAFERIEEVNRIFSDYDSDSEALRLCRQAPMAEPVRVSPEMAEVLGRALHFSRETGGALDVTAGPLTRLWRRARRQRELPSPQRLEQARAAVGEQHVELDSQRQTVRLTAPGMRLDFGAIAKGYGSDEALRVLREKGVNRALVNGGGDLRLGDPPPGASGWRVGIAPLNPDEPPRRVLKLADCGVATSGDAWQTVEIDSQRYSHILDARTGRPLSERTSVTVLADDCMTADALASAVTLLGVDQGLALVDRTPGASCLIITIEEDQPKIYTSQRFPACSVGDEVP